tara:strand:+ start:2777 stop:3460 length:684 start_codon:yes stop_codon:yes gene_type:complete
MEAIILAGGFGKRLKKVVKDLPKPMAKIGSKPFLEFIFEKLNKEGFEHVVLSTGYLSHKIESYFGNRYKNIMIDYSFEASPLGTGGATKKAIDLINGDYFYVFNGDSFIDVEIEILDKKFKETNKQIIVGIELQSVSRYGHILESNGRIIGFEEKRNSGKGIINAGCYVLSKDVFKNYKLKESFSIENDFFPKLIFEEEIMLFLTKNKFIDIGTPEDYESAFQILSK